jgi:hypothetical protein
MRNPSAVAMARVCLAWVRGSESKEGASKVGARKKVSKEQGTQTEY